MKYLTILRYSILSADFEAGQNWVYSSEKKKE